MTCPKRNELVANVRDAAPEECAAAYRWRFSSRMRGRI